MRKVLSLIVAMFCYIPWCLYANENEDLLFVDQLEDGIGIDIELPSYTISDTNLLLEYGKDLTYSYIHVENDEYDAISQGGYPLLPFMTIDLQIPSSACNNTAIIESRETDTIQLSKRIMPSPKEGIEDEHLCFMINEEYYQSNGEIGLSYEISEPYIIMGQKGITFMYCPFEYNPMLGQLIVTKKCSIKITYDIGTSKSGTYETDSPSDDAVTESYLCSVFANRDPSSKSSTSTTPKSKGNYLIITDHRLKNALTYFVNYKKNIGYNVQVATTSGIGITATEIKSYIQEQYNNKATRPNFVLLVGDITKIPQATGTVGDGEEDDPISDVDYVRLDGNDVFVDAFIGRFPVSSPEDLQNIINKTIFMERELYEINKHKAILMSGDGDGEKKFTRVMNKVDKKMGNNGYATCRLSGKSGKGATNFVTKMNDTSSLFSLVVYRGHGGKQVIYINDDDNIYVNTFDKCTYQKTFPMFFSIACWSANYSNQSNIGVNYVVRKNGGCSFFGATTPSDRSLNQHITKKMFCKANYDDHNQLGKIVTQSLKDTYGIGMFRYQDKNEMLRQYNLLGDPSLFVRGIAPLEQLELKNNEEFHSGDEIKYTCGGTISQKSSFKMDAGSKVELEAKEKIILTPGFKVEKGASFKVVIK